MKKIVSTLLAVSCLTSFVACGTPVDNSGSGANQAGADKTTIKVANYDGGIGSVWIQKAAERFAELRKETSYAKGKQGVFVDVERAEAIGTTNISRETTDIYFMERYIDVQNLAKQGLVYDVSSVFTDETRVGGKLENAVYDNALDALKLNGKYYGVPHYEFFGGVTYDREAFDDNLAYFAAEDETDVIEYNGVCIESSCTFIGSLGAKKSKGSDGIEGTEDDGLPCSAEEYILLMDYFANETEYAPMVVSGRYLGYAAYFVSGMWASLAGYEQMCNYYNCTGEIEIVTGYTDEPIFPGIDYIKKPTTQKVNLTEEDCNGYLGNTMAAKYYALALLEIMEREGFFSNDSYVGTVDQYGAQKCLIYDGVASYKKVAMLMEGSYWYNESKNGRVFEAYETLSQNKVERDLRFMPLPTSLYTDGAEAKASCLLDIGQAYGIVNANIAGDDETISAVLDFLSFLYSEEELKYFTEETGMGRAIAYSVDNMGGVSNFYKDLWNLRDDGKNVVYYSGTTETFKKVKDAIRLDLNCLRLNPSATSTFLAELRSNTTKLPSKEYKRGTKVLFEATQLSEKMWREYLGL